MLFCCSCCRRSLLDDTTVSSSTVSTGAGGSSSDAVAPASLSAVGASSQTNFSGGGLQGFVLDIPADVDEADAVSKLSAHKDVMRVVPDTWVGIAAAKGEPQQGAHHRTQSATSRRVAVHGCCIANTGMVGQSASRAVLQRACWLVCCRQSARHLSAACG